MKLVAHQAVYGEVNGAHTLIAKSSEAKSPFFELARRTDRPPGHLPPNLQWQSYLSGNSVGDYYILTRTFPDETASRSGMVITHALVFALDEFAFVNDLNSVLRLLPTVANRTGNLVPVEFEVPDKTVPIIDTPGLGNVIRLLLDEAGGEKPVVWIGQENFEPVIAAVWQGLWPSARKTFKFRLSFTPQDVEGQELTIVSTPSQMENRWSGFPIARVTDVYETQTKSEAFLMGQGEGEPLRALLRDLETEPATISDLQKLQASSDYLESIRNGTISVNGARSLVRLLGTLSKPPEQGAKLKAQALQTLMRLTAKGTAADIQALKNLDLHPLKSGVQRMKEAVAEWFGLYAFVEEKVSSERTADMLAMSFAASRSPWTNVIHDSLREALKNWPPLAAAAIWRWWERSPSLVTSLEKLIPNSEQAQSDLAKQCPTKLTKKIAESTRAFAQEREWLVLHAAIVGAYLAPSEAFYKQLEIDTNEDYWDGLRLLSSREPAAVLIKTALSTTDLRLLRIAGESCNANTGLLADFDLQNEAWRKIWLFSMEAGNEPWAGIDNPRRVMDDLIDLVIDRGGIDDALLRQLSHSEFADLSSYHRRAEAWNRLELGAREDFINATADGWLKRLRTDPTLEEAVEHQLEAAILSPARITQYLTEAGGNIAMLVNVFRRFQRLTPAQFEFRLRHLRPYVR